MKLMSGLGPFMAMNLSLLCSDLSYTTDEHFSFIYFIRFSPIEINNGLVYGWGR